MIKSKINKYKVKIISRRSPFKLFKGLRFFWFPCILPLCPSTSPGTSRLHIIGVQVNAIWAETHCSSSIWLFVFLNCDYINKHINMLTKKQIRLLHFNQCKNASFDCILPWSPRHSDIDTCRKRGKKRSVCNNVYKYIARYVEILLNVFFLSLVFCHRWTAVDQWHHHIPIMRKGSYSRRRAE